MYSSAARITRHVVKQGFSSHQWQTRRVLPSHSLRLLRSCSSAATRFDISQIAPSPDAFVSRHIGPSEEEQREMLKEMEIKASLVQISLSFSLFIFVRDGDFE